jgi:hypothetical protein
VFGRGAGEVLSFAEGFLLSLDVGVTLGVARNVKIVLEAQMFGVAGARGFELTDAALFNYGVRFHGTDLAVDLAFIRPIGPIDLGPLLLGIPYLTFSARF